MPSGEQILQHWWNIWLYLKHTFDISSVCVWVEMGVKQSTAPVKKWKQTSEPIGKHMATPDKRDRQKIKRAKILPKGKITTHILCFGDGSVWLQARCEYGCSDKNSLHRSHRKALLWRVKWSELLVFSFPLEKQILGPSSHATCKAQPMSECPNTYP